MEKAAAEGFVTGVGNNKYNPSGTVTYAEFCTMLVRAGEEYLSLDDFESWCEWTGRDPENWREHWYDTYLWAANLGGILDNTKAKPDDFKVDSAIAESPVNRYEMAQLMYNILYLGIIDNAYLIYPEDSEIAAAKSKIADWSSVPDNYQNAVATCYAAGFLSGVDDKGTFAGDSTMDRAQAATVMCRLCNLDVESSGDNGDDNKDDETQTGDAVGQRDANGYTTAASVNSVKDRGKSDEYPTKGGASFFAASAEMIQLGKEGKLDYDGIIENAQKVSVNGYYTGSTVDAGNSVLVYDFLDMVNEARRAEGLNELEWVPFDAAEEYTLVRAKDIVIDFSHFGQHAGLSWEVIAGGYSVEEVFQSWMNSEGHRDTLMIESAVYMAAAKNGTRWIITLFNDDIDPARVERWATNNYLTK